MAFSPRVLNGRAAWKRALAKGSARPGYCLAEVHEAFGSPKSDGFYPYANATEARKRAQQLGGIKGMSLDAAPEGAVLYWSNVVVKGKDLGHIAFKGPNNTIVTIDNPTRGRWGQVSVAAFKKKWSWLVFQGFAVGEGAYLGHTVAAVNDLNFDAGPAGADKGDIMATLDQEDIDRIADAVWQRRQAGIDNHAPVVVLKDILYGNPVAKRGADIARAVWEEPQKTMNKNAAGIVLQAVLVHSENPDVQRALREEITAALQNVDVDIDEAAIAETVLNGFAARMAK